jgi:hypothetical protein
MRRILVKALRRNRVVLAVDHPTKPREERLRLIGAGVIFRIRDRMIDPIYNPTSVQRIPMVCFVGGHYGGTRNETLGDFNAFAFVAGNERPGAAVALA